MKSTPNNTWQQRTLIAAGVIGLILVFINTVGVLVPLRSADVDGYVDFAGGAPTAEFRESVRRLADLEQRNVADSVFITEATRIFHEGIAHIDSADITTNGLDHYRMRIPITENWVLFLLSYIKPSTYLDYEFCSFERALERGTGRCGQQALALVSYLSENDIETGFVALGGHAIATAKTEDSQWYLLDPDYGGVIPFSIAEAESQPESVLAHYWSDVASRNGIDQAYAPDNEIRYGGPEARFARACPIEHIAYFVKWAVPLVMLFSLFSYRVIRRIQRRWSIL